MDHSACRGSKDDWEALAQHLKGLPLGTSDHELSKLHECWDERSEWWPRYHFRIDLVPDKNQATSSEWGVALYKAEVAGVLLGKGEFATVDASMVHYVHEKAHQF